MKIIGLTGGIASGKNFVAEIFKKNGAAVFDADKEVHKLLRSDKSTFGEVLKKFPQAIISKKINRKTLGKIVFADGKKLKILEKIIHPKVRKKYQEFLKISCQQEKEFAVLNVPLLLENKAYQCDKIVAVVATKSVRKNRFLKREKKNSVAEIKNLEEKFMQITSRQISDAKRKKQADFIINNDGSKIQTARQIKKIFHDLLF